MEEKQKTPTELFLQNENLIHFVMHNRKIYNFQSDVVDDVYGECRLTLWVCALKYEFEKGYKFSTYAVTALHRTVTLVLNKFDKKTILDLPFSELTGMYKVNTESNKEELGFIECFLSTPSNVDTAIDSLACQELVYNAIEYAIRGLSRGTLQGLNSDELRNILSAYYLEDLSPKEVAAQYNITAKQVAITVQRLKGRVRNYVSRALLQ